MTCGSDEIMCMRCHTGCGPPGEPPAAPLPPCSRPPAELRSMLLVLLLLPLLPSLPLLLLLLLLLLLPLPPLPSLLPLPPLPLRLVRNTGGGCRGSCSRMWYACFRCSGGGGISTRALQGHVDVRWLLQQSKPAHSAPNHAGNVWRQAAGLLCVTAWHRRTGAHHWCSKTRTDTDRGRHG